MEVNVYTDKVKQYKPVYWLFGAAQSYATRTEWKPWEMNREGGRE